MASTQIFLLCIAILGSSLLLPTNAAVAADSPTPAPLDIESILEKGSQYGTFIKFLKSTQVMTQLSSQLKNTYDGITVLAPTDNAFNNLKAGTLNGLTAQQQSELVLYHILPRYYSFSTFETTSNPVRTQASGNEGVYTVNVTSTSNQVNVSTGVNEVQVTNALNSEFPLAVYSLDKVMLPDELFGVKPPASAPALAPSVSEPKKKKVPVTATPTTAAVPASSEAADATTSDAGLRRNVEWGFALACAFVGVLSLF
ncbi:Fasciclin-like arabinogalactan family protein [Rhynchospora pubera]|uniref:Fasciclin-like arabinogalactan family protein n=1 Tax=Rhynchospora pubera TaxID=906938 RepID=A0AAV8CCL2_9POAL|nr:Fasciclin-like arabinogalactan family protein [Rhynchospora pubera]